MKKAGIFEEQLEKFKIEVSKHFSKLIEHQNPILIETDDLLTVIDRFSGAPYDACPLKVSDDGISVRDAEKEDKTYKIYFSCLQSIEDKLLLISLMEQNMGNIKELGNLKEVGGTFNPNEI